MKKLLTILLFFSVFYPAAYGQTAVNVKDDHDQHIFTFGEIWSLEDPEGKLSFRDVRGDYNDDFVPSTLSTPQTKNLNSVYWFRVRINYPLHLNKKYLLEFFDQTIDHITAYIPVEGNRYITRKLGDELAFDKRTYSHKNFEFEIEPRVPGPHTYYFRIKSTQRADVIIVLRSVNWFIHYALDEYFSFGIFYGMILVFSFYNLLMFLAVRQRQYLDYVLYVLSVGLYQMSIDGIGYQYLWPGFPLFNNYAFGISLYLVSLFSLLFSRDLLHLKVKAPFLYKLINYLILIRTVLFVVSFFYTSLFSYRFIELIPLSLSFFAGVHIYRQGYHPARFFVLGYSLLFLGFLIKLLIELTNGAFNIGVLSYYSLSICFILEMILLSFAVGDRVRVLKLKKDKAQQRIIREMKENSRLKDILNEELESKVDQRTREVFEKSQIIKEQNEELMKINDLLKEQAEEITRMNVFLEQDNQELQTNIQKVTRARIMSADVDFSEFSKIYPDEDTCYKFLSDLKWEKGYTCRKCGNDRFFNGHLPYSRRCGKCSYEESVTTNTIFQNSRIPITKAFYMIFLVYSTKGKISSHKLSDILAIRQSTCWSYSSKIKKLMEERKKQLKEAGDKGWSKLVLD